MTCDSDFRKLVGKTPLAVLISSDKKYLRFIMSDQSVFTFEAEGDCCASAYFHEVENAEDIIGVQVVSVNVKSLPQMVSEDEIHTDTEFINFRTSVSETFNIEFRVDHNGYYGGWAKLLDEPFVVEDDNSWKILASAPLTLSEPEEEIDFDFNADTSVFDL